MKVTHLSILGLLKNALDYITITFYKGTTATETRTAGGLFSGQFFTSATNQFYVGFMATTF